METGLLSCIDSRVEKGGNLYGRFQIESFLPGQALTFANSLRRTLLSDLSGLAVVAVDIQGINHEYSNFVGMRESVIDFLLNLKKVTFTTKSTILRPQVGFLSIQGPAVIKASDLNLPSVISCVNPDQYLATLAHNGVLQMKFYIFQGTNSFSRPPMYWVNTLNTMFSKKQVDPSKIFVKHPRFSFNLENSSWKKSSRELLALDPVFLPINRVSFVIEPQDHYDEPREKIILEIWTNGSIHPKKALNSAIKSLLSLFSLFYPKKASLANPKGLKEVSTYTSWSAIRKVKTEGVGVQGFSKAESKNTKVFVTSPQGGDNTRTFSKRTRFWHKNAFRLDIANLDLSLRTYSYLKRCNINTIADLSEHSSDCFLQELGNKGLQELEKTLVSLGSIKE